MRDLAVNRQFLTIPAVLTLCLFVCAGCVGTKRLEIEGSFPIPLMEKTPVTLGIHLDEKLTTYVHKEAVEKKGEWEVVVGPAQKQLFHNLALGVFEGHTFVGDTPADIEVDGILKPTIKEVQFALPSQTRSDYFEVWIRYEFELLDRAGNLIGQWKLPAYGKANKNSYGSSRSGVQAAAMAACRDAMAFFSINFSREPSVQKWLAAGKPQSAPAEQTPPADSQSAAVAEEDAT